MGQLDPVTSFINKHVTSSSSRIFNRRNVLGRRIIELPTAVKKGLISNLFLPFSTCFLPRRPCTPAACGVRPWTSWTTWWSAACSLSSASETGSCSQTWELAAWRTSILSSCPSITPSPPLTGRSGPSRRATDGPVVQIRKEADSFGENSLLSLVFFFPAGLRCRRLELHWITPWRISPWFSTVHSCLPALSCLTLHSSSLASAFICFCERRGQTRTGGGV